VELLGIGYQELLLVLVLMLIVVGPERLPSVAYQLGRAVRTLQQYARAVRDEFKDEIGFIEEQYKTVKGEVDVTRQSLREQQAKFDEELRSGASLPPLGLGDVLSNNGASESNVVPFPTAPSEEAAPPAVEEAAPAKPPLVF
jgi:sec-independent protein translocase protein TatB